MKPKIIIIMCFLLCGCATSPKTYKTREHNGWCSCVYENKESEECRGYEVRTFEPNPLGEYSTWTTMDNSCSDGWVSCSCTRSLVLPESWDFDDIPKERP